MIITGVGRWLDDALATVFGEGEEAEEQLEDIREWLGKPCNCPDKRTKSNRLWRWAKRVNDGDAVNAEKYLSELLDEELA